MIEVYCPMENDPTSLKEMLDLLEHAADGKDQISLEMILESLGRRSFGPVLLMAGLITLAPIIGDIPGMPTIMGLLVMLTSAQLLVRREHIWLPQWMTKRSLNNEKFHKALHWLRAPARFLDYLARPRLSVVVENGGLRVIALLCFLVAAGMPLMEFIPFSANGAGLALTVFGLALTARDGLIALLVLLAICMAMGAGLFFLLF